MYKDYLKKAQKGRGSSRYGVNLKEKYVDAILKQNPDVSKKELDSLLYFALFNKDQDAANEIYKNSFGGDYKKFKNIFDKVAPKAGIDVESLDAASDENDLEDMFLEASEDYTKELEKSQPSFFQKGGLVKREYKLGDFDKKDQEEILKNRNKRGEEMILSDGTKQKTEGFKMPLSKKEKEMEFKKIGFRQKGGMLQGMPHEAGGEVITDKEGNPLVEAEGGEIIFSVEVSSMIDEGAMAYSQAKNDVEMEAIAIEIGKIVLEERLKQMQTEMQEQPAMQEQPEMEGEQGMQMQRGGEIDIMKRLELLNEF